MTRDLIAIVACLAASGFFSASETALTSLPITRLEAMRSRRGRLSRAGFEMWATAPHELLITILIGNNLVNVLASALATRIAYRISTSGSLAVVVGVMTLVILVFGEITPKTFAQRYGQWIAARVVPALYVLAVVLTPINRVLGLLGRALSRREPAEVPVTGEDLVFMARLAHRHAQLARDARFMIERVVSFQQAICREIMVPRPRVATADRSWSLGELERFLAESAHSRFPVVDGSPDEIVGVLHSKHLFRLDEGRPWTELMVPPLYVPETRRLPDLLLDFRRAGQHLAVVLDEFGGLSGVVSLEDVLELLVGEIEDEFDAELTSEVVAVADGWSVPGYLSLRRLEVQLHRAIPRPPDIDSVGGLTVHLLEDQVAPGAGVDWHGLRFEVEALEGGRPSRVRVAALPLPARDKGLGTRG